MGLSTCSSMCSFSPLSKAIIPSIRKVLVLLIIVAIIKPIKGTVFDRQNHQLSHVPDIIEATTHQLLLGNNHISTIQKGSFGNLELLESISLINNHINMIGDFAFASVSSVTLINLGGNQLEVVTKNMFSGAPNLQHIHLFLNRIHTVESDAFKEHNNLQTLKLGDNLLKSLPESVFDARSPASDLKLWMKHNPLKCDWNMCWLKQQVI